MNRTPTSIVVKVLDLTPVQDAVLKVAKAQDPTVVRCKVQHTWGIVKTLRGVFALCDEGVGPNTPISPDNKLVVPVYRHWDKHFDLFPFMDAQLTLEDLMSFKVVREENLRTFIRSFGSRLECNYNDWRRALEMFGVAA